MYEYFGFLFTRYFRIICTLCCNICGFGLIIQQLFFEKFARPQCRNLAGTFCWAPWWCGAWGCAGAASVVFAALLSPPPDTGPDGPLLFSKKYRENKLTFSPPKKINFLTFFHSLCLVMILLTSIWLNLVLKWRCDGSSVNSVTDFWGRGSVGSNPAALTMILMRCRITV